MAGIKEAVLQKTIAYILSHPDASKSEVSAIAKVSTATVARARKILIEKGLIAESRKAEPVLPLSTVEMFPEMEPAATTTDPGMLDHAAMIAMASISVQSTEDLTDDEVQRRLMRQAQLFAFNPALHPDTRMSASTLWAKLRDMRKDESIGPGKPLTLLEAVRRTKEVLQAVGIAVAAIAVQEAFYANQAPDVAVAAPGGAAEAAGPARHASQQAALEDLRPVNVGVRIDGQEQGLEHPDLPRSET